MIRAQQTEEEHPDLSNLKRELERAPRERDQANLDRDQAVLEKDKLIFERDLLRPEQDQAQKFQGSSANCDQIKPELERLQGKQQAIASGKERKMKTSIEPLKTRSRPDSLMEVKLPGRVDASTWTV